MTRLEAAGSGCYQIVERMTWALIGEYKEKYGDARLCLPLRTFILLPLHCIDARSCPHLRPIDSHIKARQAPEISVLGSAAPAYEMSHRRYV
jgi:hypothetical protein